MGCRKYIGVAGIAIRHFRKLSHLAFLAAFSVIHPQVMQTAGRLHARIRRLRFLVPEDVLDNPASLHPGDGMFHPDPKARQLAVGLFLSGR
jgi:hypothetical protein